MGAAAHGMGSDTSAHTRKLPITDPRFGSSGFRDALWANSESEPGHALGDFFYVVGHARHHATSLLYHFVTCQSQCPGTLST